MSNVEFKDIEQAARESAAQSLQAQIDDLLKGKSAPSGEPPVSLRDFVASKRNRQKPGRKVNRQGMQRPYSTEDENPNSAHGQPE